MERTEETAGALAADAGNTGDPGLLPRRDRDLLPAWARRGLALFLVLFAAWRLWLLWTTHTAIREPCDGGAQWSMAVNLVAGHGLAITDPAYAARCTGIVLGPSHHYGPLLSLLEAPFIALLGDTATTARLVFTLLFGAVAATVWWTTRDLLGRDAALLATAWATVDGTLLLYGYRLGYADPLVLLLMAWTVWAILRSLERPPFILLAGLFAALGYLTKSSVGWFFLVAGAGGVAWRLLHRGRKALADPWYRGAIVLFAAIAGAWMARNVAVFWDRTPAGLLSAWQTSPHNSAAFSYTFGQPAVALRALALRLPVLLAPLAAVVLPMWRELRRAAAVWRREDTSLVWLSAALLVAIGWAFSASSMAYEGNAPLWPDPIRYLTPVTLCLLWLALAATRGRASLARWSLFLLLAFALFGLLYGLDHAVPPPWGEAPTP
jgi:hypothetical protein